MNEINYIGENPLFGHFGHFLILLSFCSALLAAYSYWQAEKNELSTSYSWKSLARVSFGMHVGSLLISIGLIFYLMYTHRYEYQYVYSHVNDELSQRYLLSAFWEGQEGSFLLWMFWHAMLGLALIKFSRKWESPVLFVLLLVQLFILSMILGVNLGWGEHIYRIGSSPFLLLRETMNAPIFQKPDYLSLIQGKGLNPLLQNYWMTIHPPTLFLGFASTVVPFCFAIAALMRKDFTGWIKVVLPWALFSSAILGLGILMGGAWAYEALSFGGYWAWDPVENMSLVPWIVMVAALHSNVIANATQRSINATFILYALAFLLILYSTFLTRSGILGDTSVHAFTEMGLEWQLVLFIGFFLVLFMVYYLKNRSQIPRIKSEESLYSKEFWIFMGTLVLVFSSVLITFSTSIPVFNKVFDGIGSIINTDLKYLHRTAPTDAVAHYNKYQLWIGIFIGFLAGTAQYLRFNGLNWSSNWRKILTRIGISLGISLLLTWLTNLWLDLHNWQHFLLLFSSAFSIVSNFNYLFSVIKSDWKMAGSAFSHIGFGVLMVGCLASGLNKHHISQNRFAFEGLLNEEDIGKNVVLIKNMPMEMSGYEVTYLGDTVFGHTREFRVNYTSLDSTTKNPESFNINPYVLYNQDFSKLASTNPSTRHYWHKDIFSTISNLPKEEVEPEAAKAKEDSLKYKLYTLSYGDSIVTDKNVYSWLNVDKNPILRNYTPDSNDVSLGIIMKVIDRKTRVSYIARPSIILQEQLVYEFPAEQNETGVKIKLKENIFNALLNSQNTSETTRLNLNAGEVVDYQGIQIKLIGLNKNISQQLYKARSGDIAVSANLELKKDGQIYTAEPVFVIRDNKPYNIGENILPLGLGVGFLNIDPKSGKITLECQKLQKSQMTCSVEIAENFERSDFVVLEAIVFPGINLVWAGSLLMILGLAFSIAQRIKLSRLSKAYS